MKTPSLYKHVKPIRLGEVSRTGKVLRPLLGLLLCLSVTSPLFAKHLMVYGDSLSAAYGIELQSGWVALLAQDLGEEHQVSNASISGETSIGGLARLPETLHQLKPDVVLLELGANDGLRGYPVSEIKANLNSMIELINGTGAQVLLTGISVPPNYGPRYMDQFRSMFRQLAKEKNIAYIDFYDERLLTTPGFIQQDGLHPTEIAQPHIRDSVLAFLQEQDLFKETLVKESPIKEAVIN